MLPSSDTLLGWWYSIATMAVNTHPWNKEAHPGYVDLPEKWGQEESEQNSDQSEPQDVNSDSPKPRKPPKHQKPTTEQEKQLHKLVKLQNKLTEDALKDAAEAVHPPGPQMAKVPQKPSAEAAKRCGK